MRGFLLVEDLGKKNAKFENWRVDRQRLAGCEMN